MMHFRHHAEIAHRTKDRIRLLVPSRRGDADFFAWAGRGLDGLAGVKAISTNRHSGSIVIRHDETLMLSHVAEVLSAAGVALADRNSELAIVAGLPRRRMHSRAETRAELAAFVLQFALAFLSGAALVQVLELLAGNFLRAAVRSIASELDCRL